MFLPIPPESLDRREWLGAQCDLIRVSGGGGSWSSLKRWRFRYEGGWSTQTSPTVCPQVLCHDGHETPPRRTGDLGALPSPLSVNSWS